MSLTIFQEESSTLAQSFDDLLLDTIDNVFLQVFGDKIANNILFTLGKRSGLAREEIPWNIEKFRASLRELLGSGARVLERLVIKRLCSKLNMEYYETVPLNFAGNVGKLKYWLAICKWIVETPGGDLTVKRAADRGSMFMVKLPLGKEVR